MHKHNLKVVSWWCTSIITDTTISWLSLTDIESAVVIISEIFGFIMNYLEMLGTPKITTVNTTNK
jgi:hypothetical protein